MRFIFQRLISGSINSFEHRSHIETKMNTSPHSDIQTPATETVRVDLGTRSYDIIIGSGLLDDAGAHILPLLKRKKTAIVTDENVAKAQLPRLEASLQQSDITFETLVLPAGEKTKSFQQLEHVVSFLLEAGIERGDNIIALGGGVIGDLAGFAAAILRRGVSFIQMPTSLLAQVDSSVGGKTGINTRHGKNLIGNFHQPSVVLADISALDTLPERQLRAGFAEVIKYGLIDKPEFFNWLEQNFEAIFAGDKDARQHIVKISCLAKADIVARDEEEHGVRALLNLGHTFGHALEAATGYGDVLLHGEAISIGMCQAFRFSENNELCRTEDTERAKEMFVKSNLPTALQDIPADLPNGEALLDIMRQDKKSEAGKMVFILTRGIGESFISKDVDEALVLEFLETEMSTTQA